MTPNSAGFNDSRNTFTVAKNKLYKLSQLGKVSPTLVSEQLKYSLICRERLLCGVDASLRGWMTAMRGT